MKLYKKLAVCATAVFASLILCGLFTNDVGAAIEHSTPQNVFETQAPSICGMSGTVTVGSIYFNEAPDDYHSIGISVYNVSDPANVSAFLHSFTYICSYGSAYIGSTVRSRAYYYGAPVSGLSTTDQRIKFFDQTLCSTGSYACYDFGTIQSTSPGKWYDAEEIVPIKLDLTNEIAANETETDLLVCASFYGNSFTHMDGCDYSPVELYYDPVHRVRFFDCDDNLIWEEAIDIAGGSAHVPPLHAATLWDKTFDDITEDTNIKMQECTGGPVTPDPEDDPEDDPEGDPEKDPRLGVPSAGRLLLTALQNPAVILFAGIVLVTIVFALSQPKKSTKK